MLTESGVFFCLSNYNLTNRQKVKKKITPSSMGMFLIPNSLSVGIGTNRSSVTYPEIQRCEQISHRRYRISRGRRGISFRRCGRVPLEMYHLLQRCASPALTSISPAGDAASPARDVVASPNCGICDTADQQGDWTSPFLRASGWILLLKIFLIRDLQNIIDRT